MINQIQNWLNDKKRKYDDGLVLFEKFANSEIKKKYLDYFKEVNGYVEAFDMHFTMLVNKIVSIEIKMKSTPDAFKDLAQEKGSTIPSNNDDVEIDATISKVDVSTLTDEKKAIYARIQEIVPLMASIHSELDNESLTDDERKELAEQLIDLSDEKKSLWDEIDGKLKTVQTGENENEDKLIKLGYLQNRLNRINENIKRTNIAIDSAVVAGKKNLETNARSRLAMYLSDKVNIQQEITSLNESK
jgi:hypothetical protein